MGHMEGSKEDAQREEATWGPHDATGLTLTPALVTFVLPGYHGVRVRSCDDKARVRVTTL